ncbi:hypothetical protein [Ancylobacter mangrovi]|uniref:hypothetical protein n=1 Tax=Ancylobacter mangrovi TaxID=2972472 RepID=UPI0021620B9E|nr:hypothetical protein [Ancylobacter mangrovi]MCS0501471.1 hypothetical protein [Ancylobacter mangrovi]
MTCILLRSAPAASNGRGRHRSTRLPGAPWRALARPPRTAAQLAAVPALALCLSGPAAAQSVDATSAAAGDNPWNGIEITVRPLPTSPPSPYEQAISEAQTPEQPVVPSDPSGPLTGTLIDPLGPAPKASVWSSLRESAAPKLPDGTPSPYKQLTSRTKKPKAKSASLPTNMELKQGPASVSVSTTASASAPQSGALTSSEGGGSGEIKGRIGYEQDNLAVYSTGSVGASASTGMPSLYDNLAVGSTYSVPLSPLGLDGDKLGASVEMNNSAAVTTGVELRGKLGTYQRYISVQRSINPDSAASDIVKAGVLGKF